MDWFMLWGEGQGDKGHSEMGRWVLTWTVCGLGLGICVREKEGYPAAIRDPGARLCKGAASGGGRGPRGLLNPAPWAGP